MRLAVAEVIPYRLPFTAIYATARGSLAGRDLVLLRLSDSEGRAGWGEGVPLSLRSGHSLERLVADLRAWAEATAGGDVDWRTGAAAKHGPGTGSSSSEPAPPSLCPPALCAVLTGLADLEARRRGVPLWRLLGAAAAGPIPCNATLVSGSADQVAADAVAWASEGFGTFKLKVGLAPDPLASGEADPDLAQVEAVRKALGPDARIRLDANGAWSIERAAQLLRAAAPLGIELCEQPVASLEKMATLRRRLADVAGSAADASAAPGHSPAGETPIPLAADESVSSPEDAARAAELGACDIATVKLSKLGSLRVSLGGSLPLYLSSALDGPVGIAAAAHAFQALPPAELAAARGHDGPGDRYPIAQGLATQRLFAESIASRECELRGDLLHLPPGPGLGVEIDERSLASRRL